MGLNIWPDDPALLAALNETHGVDSMPYIRTPAPTGWQSIYSLANKFGIGPAAMRKVLPAFAEQHGLIYTEHVDMYDPPIKGAKGLHASPELITCLQTEYDNWYKNNKPPKHWETFFALAHDERYPRIQRRHHTMKKIIERLEKEDELTNEWCECEQVFLATRTVKYYSPVFIQRIAQELRQERMHLLTLIKTGWKTASMLATELSGNRRSIASFGLEICSKNDDQTSIEVTVENGIEKYYSPTTVEQIKQRLSTVKTRKR